MSTEQRGTDLMTPDGATIQQEEMPSLVALAIEKGVDVDVLERIVALQERVTERDARTEFFRAVAAFQDECPEIHKSASAEITTSAGGSYGYTYAPLQEITRTIRPILQKHGLSYSWTTEPSGQTNVLNVVCVLRHIEGHEERASFPVPTDTNAKMSAAQKNGAALTYGRRQSLEAVLGLTTADDVDGAEGLEPITPEQIEEINKLVTKSGANYPRFLAFLEIDDLGQLQQRDFEKAKNALLQKAGQSL